MSELANIPVASAEPPLPTDRGPETPTIIPADRLFGTTREVWIDHNGVRYRLRVTRRGRLILTK